MSIRSLRARLERLQAHAGERYVIGQDRDRDRNRREELFYRRLNPGLTDAETAEKAELDASFEEEDRARDRRWKLLFKPHFGETFTEEERTEYAELFGRYPPDPNDNDPYKDAPERLLAALEKARHRNHPSTGGWARNNSQPNQRGTRR